jgi:hypothetical protein
VRASRRFLDQARKVGDALRRGETADGTHRLLARAGIDPGADRMRDHEPKEED